MDGLSIILQRKLRCEVYDMMTKYGNDLSTESIMQYLDRLVGKCFKLLPLWETDKVSFLDNHKTLMSELCAGDKVILYCGFYIELINKLESLTEISEHKFIKKNIRECIDIVQKLKLKAGDWGLGNIEQ
jgi:hypothetical protein